jgi:hypothetical protein
MFTVPVLLVAGLMPVSAEADKASAAQVRQAVGRSLPYLLASSEEWRRSKACATCHQVPFTLWGFQEARAHGIDLEPERARDLRAWAFDFCLTDGIRDKDGKPIKNGKRTGGYLATMVDIILAHQTAAPDKPMVAASDLFMSLIAAQQRPDGSWLNGRSIGLKGGKEEIEERTEVDTMWTLLALSTLGERGDALDPQTRSLLASARAKGLARVKNAVPGRRIDWLALRLLIERRYGDKSKARQWRQALLKQQNPDGGWPFVKQGPSHAAVTGEVLYALNVAGMKCDEPAVRRAVKYLLDTQQRDGSWHAVSREDFVPGRPAKVSAVTVHWGTGWATIGLLRTLPLRPAEEARPRSVGLPN